jgi:glycosyltransferase involved in cell wall biosynthesis
MGSWLDAHVEDYSLVHIHGLFSHVNGLAGRICRRRGVHYVVTPHGMANRYGMRHKPWRKTLSFFLVERTLLERAAAIHMTSRGEESEFADLRIATPVVRIPLVVRPVPWGDGNAFRARHPETDGRRIAVFMGRLNPIKNLEAAIDALALPDGRDFHLVVCGGGSANYTQRLKARAIQRGVATKISWLGFVFGQEKADVLAAGDVYVQPSLSESFGMAAVEAVSAGLPCVLSDNVAISEELVNAGFALNVQPTAESLAIGLKRACFLSKRTPEYTDQAREFVVQNFSEEVISADIRNLYERALGRHERCVT